MTNKLLIDLISRDESSGEWVLYLVEDGGWPSDENELLRELRRVQNRVYDAFDALVDGHIAKLYPDSAGANFRIQVDSPTAGEHPRLRTLLGDLGELFRSHKEYAAALLTSPHVGALRLVTGHQLGRFRWERPLGGPSI